MTEYYTGWYWRQYLQNECYGIGCKMVHAYADKNAESNKNINI